MIHYDFDEKDNQTCTITADAAMFASRECDFTIRGIGADRLDATKDAINLGEYLKGEVARNLEALRAHLRHDSKIKKREGK